MPDVATLDLSNETQDSPYFWPRHVAAVMWNGDLAAEIAKHLPPSSIEAAREVFGLFKATRIIRRSLEITKVANPGGGWRVLEAAVVNGVRHGAMWGYWLDDNEESRTLVYIKHFKDGKQDGKMTAYNIHTHDVIATSFWKDGKKNGVETVYFAPGVVFSTSEFVNGLQHGITEEYDVENDTKASSIQYFEGVKHGFAIQFHKNGKASRIARYEYGLMKSDHYFDDTGARLDAT